MKREYIMYLNKILKDLMYDTLNEEARKVLVKAYEDGKKFGRNKYSITDNPYAKMDKGKFPNLDKFINAWNEGWKDGNKLSKVIRSK